VNDLLVLLGRRVHELRAAKKWSQEEFAHVSGLHRTYVGQIERGEKNISFDNLSKVASALDLTLSALLEGLENRRAPNVKPGQAETGSSKATAHEQLEIRKLVRRLKLQHSEMSRTIQSLADLPEQPLRKPTPSRARPERS
jgi:transcriptional regulator with XRE-family HTH domain